MTGTIPPTFAEMTKLEYIWVSANKVSLFSGVLPNLDSLTGLTEFAVMSDGLIGVFPDISNMPDFYWCQALPSDLCRSPEIDVSIYEALGDDCDAASLPVCTAQDLIDIADAQAEAAVIQAAYTASRLAAPVTTTELIAAPTSDLIADPTPEPTAEPAETESAVEPAEASAARPSFAAPGTLTVLLLVLAIL
jgi:hypothetical protein